MNSNPKNKNYEYFDHTADVGLYIYGSHFENLIENAGKAFTDTVSDVSCIDPQISVEFLLKKDSPEKMIHHFLNELIYFLDTRQLLLSHFMITKVKEGYMVQAKGDVFNPLEHPFKTAIKAITHHQLQVETYHSGLKATVVFDL